MIDFENYIKPELGFLIPLLYIIGMMIKNTNVIKDKWIPLILGIIGIVISFFTVGSIEGFTLVGTTTAITQGVLCAGSAVYVNQLFKQSGK